MTISQTNIDAMFEGQGAPESHVSSQGTSAPPPHPLRTAKPDVLRILALVVPVSVVLAERDMPLENVLQLTVGSIVEFEAAFDSELTVHVANHPIGIGQAVKVGEHFGLRVTKIGSVRDRIDALAGR